MIFFKKYNSIKKKNEVDNKCLLIRENLYRLQSLRTLNENNNFELKRFKFKKFILI